MRKQKIQRAAPASESLASRDIQRVLGALVVVAGALLVASACAPRRLSGAVRADIARQMVAKRSPLAACYKAALKRDRTMAGRLVVNFTVQANGSFGTPTIANSGVKDAKFTTCIDNTLQGIRLSVRGPDRPVIVSYPVDFRPTAVP